MRVVIASAPSPPALITEYERFRSAHPDRSLLVGDTRWQYIVGGAGSSAILVLPGGSMRPDSYFRLIGVLERENRLIAPTYPAVATVADLAEGAIATLDTEQVARAAVFGASFGGYIAQILVRRHPERFDRLVLSHTAVRHLAGRRPMRALAALLPLLPERLVRAVMWRIWMHLFSVPTDARLFWQSLMRGVLDDLSKAQLVGITRCISDFTGYQLTRDDLAAWPGRVLILESDRDAAFGPTARAELRATYPGATVFTFRDAGHTALWTDADEYNERVRSFLAAWP